MSVTKTDPFAAKDDVIGQRCGGSYLIASLLGEGGMGAVYLATSEMLAGKPAAVKVLLPDLSRRSDGLARFRAEVYAAGKIDDPNIVKVFDAGELHDGRLYMLMEYCSSGSLEALLRERGALPLELIITILAAIGSALHVAHTEAKITHRDIKPANILLAHEPGGMLRAKLADFGIAKLHDLQLAFGMRTGTQKIMGSPGYIAPEQCAGKGGVDSRADIYAFGSVLYEMVTGQRPYPGNSVFELIQHVISNAPFPPAGQLRRDLPPEWERVIMGCLAHRREDRIQTIQEVIRRLARAIPNGESLMSYVAPRLVDNQAAPTAATISDGIGPAATQWANAMPRGRSGGRRRFGLVAAAMAAGIVIGGGGIAVVDRIAREARDGSAEIPHDPASVVSAGVRPDAAVLAGAAGASTDRVVLDAAVLTTASVAADASTTADANTDAPMAVAIGVAHAPVRPPDKPQTDRPAPMGRAPVTAPGAREAAIVVRVRPFADVTIDNVAAGTTPVRKNVSFGVHHVVLQGADKREELDITIDSTKDTIISRSW